MASSTGAPLLADNGSAGKSRFDVRGCLYLVGLIVTWVVQSEVCQLVQVEHYNKPMAITWFNHSAGVAAFPLMLLGGGSASECYAKLAATMSGSSIIRSAFCLSFVYLLADWLWYIGLPYTSVAAGTTIFNTSSCWVAVVLVLLGEPYPARHAVAISLTILGVFVVSRDPGTDKESLDPGSHDKQLLGNAFVLLAAVGYAVYEVFFDKSLGRVDGLDALTTNMFVSIMSAVNLVLLWPCALLLGSGVLPAIFEESLELPSATAARGLCANAVLATAFNVFLALAVVRTSPLLTSVACAMTIPMALVVDVAVHGDSFDFAELFGSALIVAGFLTLALDKVGKS